MSLATFYKISGARLGQTVRRWLPIDEDYFGFPQKIPYIHIRGAKAGTRGVLFAAVHGDELNGVRMLFALADIIDPQKMEGELLLLPVTNAPAFFFQSRYLPDRRDLNRLFPGDIAGSEGSRLANRLWKSFIEEADFGIDLHSASYNRWNFPHIRGNMRSDRVRFLARAFGAPITIHSQGVIGSLRREATKRNIPIILFEAGQANRIEEDVSQIGIMGILQVLHQLEMYNGTLNQAQPDSSTYFKYSSWVRARKGGFFIPKAQPGDWVKEGEVLGEIKSVLGKFLGNVESQLEGRILGFNLHPQVVPGRALYHLCYSQKDL